MFAAAKNLGEGSSSIGDMLARLRARAKARHGEQAKKDLDASGLPIMSAAAVQQAAIDDDGYETPELNDRLYLHFKGFRKIQNLEPYTSLKALWLGGNGISEIEGIDHLSQLRCLYLERNLITCIKGLQGLENLVQLDLSQNRIDSSKGLHVLPALHTLNLAKNVLGDAEAVAPLSECPSLSNLDVTGNRLAGPGVIDVLASLKRLVSLSLAGNPILSETAHIRKTVITAAPKLRYLDRPVFDAERVAAAAWTVGGVEAEREARTKYQEDRRNEDRKQMQIFRDWQAEQRRKKKEEIEARAAAGLGELGPTAEEMERDSARTAQAKAEAEEDRKLIREVGLCKIGDAFYAAEKDGSRRHPMETLEAPAKEVFDGEGVPQCSNRSADTDVMESQTSSADAPDPSAASSPIRSLQRRNDRATAERVSETTETRHGAVANEAAFGHEGPDLSPQHRSTPTTSVARGAREHASDKQAPAIDHDEGGGGIDTVVGLTKNRAAADRASTKAEQKGIGPELMRPGGPEDLGGGERDREDADCGNGSGSDADHGDDCGLRQEKDEEAIRRVRVAQSLAIYRAQLAAERRQEGLQHVDEATDQATIEQPRTPGSEFQRRLAEASAEVAQEASLAPQISRRSDSTPASAGMAFPVSRSCTWAADGEVPEALAVTRGHGGQPLHRDDRQSHRSRGAEDSGAYRSRGHSWEWTKEADRLLVEQVRSCEFDFEQVAANLSNCATASREHQSASILGGSRAITGRDCRLRFALLDQDGVRGGNTSASAASPPTPPATSPRSSLALIAPGVMENAGLSFVELEARSRDAKSRFLTHPTAFPSTIDGGNDCTDDLHDDDVREEFGTASSANEEKSQVHYRCRHEREVSEVSSCEDADEDSTVETMHGESAVGVAAPGIGGPPARLESKVDGVQRRRAPDCDVLD